MVARSPPEHWQRTLPLFDTEDYSELGDLLMGLRSVAPDGLSSDVRSLAPAARNGDVTAVRLHVGVELPDELPVVTPINDQEVTPGEFVSRLGTRLATDGEWGQIRDELHSLAERIGETPVEIGLGYDRLEREETTTQSVGPDDFEGTMWERTTMVADHLEATGLVSWEGAACHVAHDLYALSVDEIGEQLELDDDEVEANLESVRDTIDTIRGFIRTLQRTGRYDADVLQLSESAVAGPIYPEREAGSTTSSDHAPEESFEGRLFIRSTRWEERESPADRDRTPLYVARAEERPSDDGARGYLVQPLDPAEPMQACSADQLELRWGSGLLLTGEVVWAAQSHYDRIESVVERHELDDLPRKALDEIIEGFLTDSAATLDPALYAELEHQIAARLPIDPDEY